MDNNNDQAGSQKPVRNLKGLLKFCLEATKNEDASSDSTCEQISPERRQWLEEALSSMTVSTAKKCSECLESIEKAEINTEEGTEQIITALTELQDWVEDLDIAQDFITIKGLRVIPSLLNSEVSEIRWRCLELLANLCQNNPRTQAAVLQSHFLPPILLLIDSDSNPLVRVKAVYALSCLSRNNMIAQRDLISNNGLEVLVRALDSEEEKLRMKASFMISAISSENPALKDVFLDKNLAEHMIICLKKEHCTSHEHLLAAFVSLVDQHRQFTDFCLQEKFHMKSFLSERIKFLAGKEDFQDEKSNAEQLLVALNSPPTQVFSSSSSPSQLSLMPA